MVVMVPAILLGLVAIFLGAKYIIAEVLTQFARWNKSSSTYTDDMEDLETLELAPTTIQRIFIVSVIGGLIAVALVIYVYRDAGDVLWYGLTALGFIYSIYTFINKSTNNEAKTKSYQGRINVEAINIKTNSSPTQKSSNHHNENQTTLSYSGKNGTEAEKKRQVEYRTHLDEIQKRKTKLKAVSDDLYTIFSMPDDGTIDRGHKLAGIINRLFDEYNIPVVDSFDVINQNVLESTEQIEGSIKFCDYVFLVEVKWQKKHLNTQEVSQLLVRLFNSGYQGGIFITNSEFTLSAILDCEKATMHKPIVLCEMEELVLLLESNGNLREFLQAKINAAIFDKEVLYKPLANST